MIILGKFKFIRDFRIGIIIGIFIGRLKGVKVLVLDLMWNLKINLEDDGIIRFYFICLFLCFDNFSGIMDYDENI